MVQTKSLNKVVEGKAFIQAELVQKTKTNKKDSFITQYSDLALTSSLACMFCFPNVGHVIILQRTVSFKFWIIPVHVYA